MTHDAIESALRVATDLRQQRTPSPKTTEQAAQAITDLVGELRAQQALLEGQKVIRRCKAMLIRTYRWTENEAHRWMARRAMDRRETMQKVAQGVLDGSIKV